MRINRQRLEDTFAQLRSIGETPRGGLTRLALSDEDKRARDQMVARGKAHERRKEREQEDSPSRDAELGTILRDAAKSFPESVDGRPHSR